MRSSAHRAGTGIVIRWCLVLLFYPVTTTHGFVPVLKTTFAKKSHPSASHALRMSVSGIESTPNPSSFLLHLSSPLENSENIGSLRGKTYTPLTALSDLTCPPEVLKIVQIDGVVSVYAMFEALTVSKHPSANWEVLLPSIVDTLGGADSISVAELLAVTGGAEKTTSNTCDGVRIRLQMSNDIPIQVETTGFLGTVRRAKLSGRFGDAMSEAMTDGGDFFSKRIWVDRGVRYPDSEGGSDDSEAERESRETDSVLLTEIGEVEEAYPPSRLERIVRCGGKNPEAPPSVGNGVDTPELDLEAVDRLCASADHGDAASLQTLASFVGGMKGSKGARRNALAYLGGAGDRADRAVLSAVVSCLLEEKNPMMRRTAGDALSDLGDESVVMDVVPAIKDRSKLVRWRVARVFGELGGTEEALDVLRTAIMEEKEFEVVFELKDAIRKVTKRCVDRDGGAMNGDVIRTGPIWKQIQDGTSLDSKG